MQLLYKVTEMSLKGMQMNRPRSLTQSSCGLGADCIFLLYCHQEIAGQISGFCDIPRRDGDGEYDPI